MSFGGSPTLYGILRSAKKEGLRKRNLSDQERTQQIIRSAESEVRADIRQKTLDLAKSLEAGCDLDCIELSVGFGHTEEAVFTAQKNAARKLLIEEGFKNVRIENTGQSDGGTYWARASFEIPEEEK
ncbi:MAG: hypothetical protein HY225_00285 [Candidatus Vogelbacteria bacterium]|nr:hypothetical protein [Candidatus Vogelbacteria bacterium]